MESFKKAISSLFSTGSPSTASRHTRCTLGRSCLTLQIPRYSEKLIRSPPCYGLKKSCWSPTPNGSVPVLSMYRPGLKVQTYRVLYSYWKPESARTHPEATVRPWATVQVVGDALSFASALGYMLVSPSRSSKNCLYRMYFSKRTQIYKRGYVFRRGRLVVQIFQEEQVHFLLIPKIWH
jgi:hypothetical protein